MTAEDSFIHSPKTHFVAKEAAV